MESSEAIVEKAVGAWRTGHFALILVAFGSTAVYIDAATEASHIEWLPLDKVHLYRDSYPCEAMSSLRLLLRPKSCEVGDLSDAYHAYLSKWASLAFPNAKVNVWPAAPLHPLLCVPVADTNIPLNRLTLANATVYDVFNFRNEYPMTFIPEPQDKDALLSAFDDPSSITGMTIFFEIDCENEIAEMKIFTRNADGDVGREFVEYKLRAVRTEWASRSQFDLSADIDERIYAHPLYGDIRDVPVRALDEYLSRRELQLYEQGTRAPGGFSFPTPSPGLVGAVLAALAAYCVSHIAFLRRLAAQNAEARNAMRLSTWLPLHPFNLSVFFTILVTLSSVVPIFLLLSGKRQAANIRASTSPLAVSSSKNEDGLSDIVINIEELVTIVIPAFFIAVLAYHIYCLWTEVHSDSPPQSKPE